MASVRGLKKGSLPRSRMPLQTEIEGIVELDTFRILYDRRHLPSENSRKRKKGNGTMNDRSSQQSCDIPLSLTLYLSIYLSIYLSFSVFCLRSVRVNGKSCCRKRYFCYFDKDEGATSAGDYLRRSSFQEKRRLSSGGKSARIITRNLSSSSPWSSARA